MGAARRGQEGLDQAGQVMGGKDQHRQGFNRFAGAPHLERLTAQGWLDWVAVYLGLLLSCLSTWAAARTSLPPRAPPDPLLPEGPSQALQPTPGAHDLASTAVAQGTEGLWVMEAVDPQDPCPEDQPLALPGIRLLMDKKAVTHLMQVGGGSPLLNLPRPLVCACPPLLLMRSCTPLPPAPQGANYWRALRARSGASASPEVRARHRGRGKCGEGGGVGLRPAS